MTDEAPWQSDPVAPRASGPWEGDPVVSVAEDVRRSVGPGLIRGAAGLIGTPAFLAELGAKGIDTATQFVGKQFGIDPEKTKRPTPRAEPVLPEAGKLLADYERESGYPLYKPQTTPGKYVHTAAEFVPGTLAGPLGRAETVLGVAGNVARNVGKFGIVPGLASEAAGQATEGTPYETPARIIAGIAGGAAVPAVSHVARGAFGSSVGQIPSVLRAQMPAGVTPQMVDAAGRLIDDAANAGMRLSWPEALSQVAQSPVLTNVLRHAEAAPASEARMAQFFGGRVPAIDAAAERQFNTITPPTMAPNTIGPQVGRAAEGVLTDVRDIINARTEPFYQAAENVRLTPQEMARVRALPGYDEASRAVRGDPQLNRYVSHLPEDSVGFLNEVKKYLDQASENAARPMAQQPNMQRAAGYGRDARAAREIGIAASPEYEVALAAQEGARRQFLEPLLQGPLGRLAQSDITTQRAIEALFPRNPLPNSAGEITTAVGALAQRSPDAARELVRAHMQSTFNEAARSLQSGVNQAAGAKFRVALAGNPQQAANLEAAVRALPNGDQLWPGINRFLDVMEATGTRQNIGSRTAYNTEFLKQLGTSPLETAASPFAGLRDRFQRWQLGQNLDELARLLTDRQSGALLRAISRMPVHSDRAHLIAGRLAQLAVTSGTDQLLLPAR